MNNMITKPLLAVAVKEAEDIKYPVLATKKLDGIRCLMINGAAVTRNFKPLPNVYIAQKLAQFLPNGFDGEVMIRGTNNFNDIQSAVMSRDGEPDFVYNAFDYVNDSLDLGYEDRIKAMVMEANSIADEYVKYLELLTPTLIETPSQLAEFEATCLADGYEGVMIRKPNGSYKCGRSTLKEGILLKVKRFQDAEAIVIGYEEKMTNNNIQEMDAFGHSKRSSKLEGLVGAETLGAIEVRDINSGIEFKIGTGFDDKIRAEIWANRDTYKGKLLTYKSQPVGVKEKPRFPVFLHFRHPDDHTSDIS